MAELDKDAFLSTVIHELRAPLNACLMSVNLLELKASQPEEVLRCAEVFRRNLDRQAHLIQDLADVLQIVSGGIELDTETVDLRALAGAAAERLRTGTEQSIEVSFEGDPSVHAEVDSERLGRVLDTLLQHEAGMAGAQTLSLRLSKAGPRARVALRRIGGGDSTAVRDQKGFAVRLAVAEQVIDAHGGRLERADDGFTVELPAAG